MNNKNNSMKSTLTTLLIVCTIVGLIPAQTATGQTLTAKQIIEKMEAQMRGNTLYAEMTMTTVRPRYTREVTMKTWMKGEKYSMVLITAPARDKGTAYLKRDKEIWNYVPNIDKLIKLPPSMMSQSWMGSDFSNDDLVRESSNINDFTHKIIDTVKYGGYDCWVLELTPKQGTSIIYGKVKIWVSQKHYLQLRIENYDDKQVLVSTMLFKNVKTMGGRMMPTEVEIIPAGKKGHKTMLKYLDAKFNAPIEDSFFTVQNMKTLK
jgi:outer membrane lipoprotein-sorting protein